MGAFEAILVLGLVGFLMLAAEVFVPGMVLGLLGGLFLAGAVVVAFVNYGPFVGAAVFAGLSALTLMGFIAWMAAFPHTAIGRRIMLSKSLPQGEGRSGRRKVWLGHEGKALTPLRPAGTAEFDGARVDVLAEHDFIGAGEPLLVVREEGSTIVVRKKV